MFERFTKRARHVLLVAQDLARGQARHIGTEHLLLGLLADDESVAARALFAAGITYEQAQDEVVSRTGGSDADALAAIGIDVDAITAAVDESFGEGALERSMHGKGGRGASPFAPMTKKTLELSLREALALGHNYIGTEHLLLAILRLHEGVAYDILDARIPSLDELRAAVVDSLKVV